MRTTGKTGTFPCPLCGTDQPAVVTDSRVVEDKHRRRRRQCICGHRYTTIELVETTAIEKQKLRRAIEALAEAV